MLKQEHTVFISEVLSVFLIQLIAHCFFSKDQYSEEHIWGETW